MLELVVSLCLVGAPADCREEVAGVYETEAVCQAAGREMADPEVQAWTCGRGPFWVSEVAPGVYVHKGYHAEPGPANGADTANIGYIIGDEAVAVIDAGGSDAVARALLADIRARTDLPVRYLILTHMHPDHVLGAGVFVANGAEVIGHPGLAAALAARYGHYHTAYTREMGAGWTAAAEAPAITAAPEALDLGGRVIELRAHGVGHTSNDLSMFDRETGTWFLGDLVFLGHMPAIGGALIGWQEVLRAAQETPAAHVVPGHGPVVAEWPEAAQPTIDYLESLTTEIRAAIAKGTPLIDVVTAAETSEMPFWLLSGTFHPRNVTAAFRELEWE